MYQQYGTSSQKFAVTTSNMHAIYTGWPEKNIPNFRMALCNRVREMNQQKSMYVMSKHLQICV